MKDDKHSPEERLLNIIKKKDKKEATVPHKQGEPKEAVIKEQEVKKDFAWETFLEPLFLFKINAYDLNIIHHCLITIAALLLFYFFYNFYSYFSYKQDISFKSFVQDKKVAVEEKVNIFNLKPFSHYDIIGKKKLFKIYESPRKKTPMRVPKSDTSIQKKLTAINLLGIIWDEGEPQAIIEDKRGKSTYYVYEGDMIGDIRVEKIEQGRVIVTYGDEEGELSI
jgi:hypothetical protein